MKNHLVELMKDVFANYIIQQIVMSDDANSQERNKDICQKLKGKIYELSLNKFSCRVIQKIIE